MEKSINCFDKLFAVSKFTNFESVVSFYKKFDIIETIKEFNNYLFNLNENDFYDYLDIISLSCNHIDLLIASLAPYSYKDTAYFLQQRLNLLRTYLENIPQSRKKFNEYIGILKEQKIENEENIFQLINKFNFKSQKNEIDTDKENYLIKKEKLENKKIKKTEIAKIEGKIETKIEIEDKIEAKIETEQKQITIQNEQVQIESVQTIESVQIKEEPEKTTTDRETITEEIEENKNKLKLEEIKKRIEKRNRLIQTLIDIYHEKKNGYKLMLNLFRGLDIYRRMSLTGENFNKELFLKNFKKYITFFKDANLIKLCLEKNQALDEATVKSMIVDCLKIINKQIDKSRFKIFFSDKLNYRSGFNEEFQQKVRWLYFPERRRPKRNIDELYSIKSVTKFTDHLKKLKNFKSYISFLSKRDIDIANQLLPVLHKIYYKDPVIRTFMIKIFHSIDKYEYSLHELTEEKRNNFKLELKNVLFNKPVSENKPTLLKIMIDLNPKINPNDIKNLLPICINIMKEKIDIGFERKKKEFPILANSFNPLEKYYQVYDKKLFIIYKRI